MFADKTKIYVKAGNGGKGMTSFLRMKGIANGGPNGGDGGKGGDIVFQADPSMNNLAEFYFKVHFRAENGSPGEPNRCNGKNGADMIIKVPVGTVIRDFETQAVMADLFYPDSSVTLLKGGRGGKGNAAFKTSTRQAPSFSQQGEETKEYALTLELKTIADVGLAGFPNAGKSTLLASVSAARPKIANYPFTTLTPNLGVVRHYDQTFVMADIPGLIEGAAEGAGLGHAFLRHVERTRMLVQVVDLSGAEGRDPAEDFRIIDEELKRYSEELAALPRVVAANKIDLPSAAEHLEALRKLSPYPVIPISAVTGQNVKTLLDEVCKLLSTLPPLAPLQFEPFAYEKEDASSFEVVRDERGRLAVVGGLVERLAREVRLDDIDSFRYFQRQLRTFGVIDRLREAGAKQGDIVVFSDIEFEFVD